MKKILIVLVVLLVSPKMFCQTLKDLAPYRIPVYQNVDEYKKIVGKRLTYIPFKNVTNTKLFKKFGNPFNEIKIEELSAKYLEKEKAIKTYWRFDTPGSDLELTVYFGDSLKWDPKLNHLKSKNEITMYDFPLYNLNIKRKYKLSKVVKPDNPEIQYGDIKIITDSLEKYCYEDNTIDITMFVLDNNIDFKLKNKSQHSLKIIWNEGVFVDENGSTSAIVHGDIKVINAEKEQIPTTIIRGANLEDIVVPIRNIYWDDNINKWQFKSIEPILKWDETRQIQMMLPIQIKGVTNEYVFIFDMFLERNKAVD